ncbi:MAG: hypothetical protein ACRD4R_04675 [Candidatus Acidiferrales bacterium]
MDQRTKDVANRASYLRWQRLAITQLGYTINLMMLATGATLGFVLKEKLDHVIGAGGCAWRAALISLGISILAAIAANVTRSEDFRYSRRAARARMQRDDKTHDRYQRMADCLGTVTRVLFYGQAATFVVGILALAWVLLPAF